MFKGTQPLISVLGPLPRINTAEASKLSIVSHHGEKISVSRLQGQLSCRLNAFYWVPCNAVFTLACMRVVQACCGVGVLASPCKCSSCRNVVHARCFKPVEIHRGSCLHAVQVPSVNAWTCRHYEQTYQYARVPVNHLRAADAESKTTTGIMLKTLNRKRHFLM